MIIIRHTIDHIVLSGQNSSAFIVVCFVLNFRISKVKKGIIDSIISKSKCNKYDFTFLLLSSSRNQNCEGKLLMGLVRIIFQMTLVV